MNWKEHSILAFLMGIPFSSDFIAFCVIISGALFPDLDHDKKEEILYKNILFMLFIVVLLILLYYFKRELFDFSLFVASFVLFIFLLVITHLEHRGLTHSIFFAIPLAMSIGYIIFSISKFSITLSGVLILYLLTREHIFSKILIFLIFIQAVFEIFHFNAFIDLSYLGWLKYSVLFFIGYLSHLFGDSITPQGVKLFKPFSNFKMDIRLGVLIILLYFVFLIFSIYKIYWG